MGRIIKIFPLFVLIFCLCSCVEKIPEAENVPEASSGWNITGTMPLEYAEQFSVDYYDNGCSMIAVNTDKFLLVPENFRNTESMPECTAVITQPVENIYLAASSAMDLFGGLESLDSIKFTATKESDWSLDYIKDKISSGEISYAGKYSAPDYEQLVSGNCGLAIESTMIYHSPDIKEQLENLGIPVLVERSSYESHPLGRMEWIKLYGLITGKEKEAQNFFNEKMQVVENLGIPEGKKKTAAFFSINPNGYVTVHKPGDYVSRMIELAGGEYIFTPKDLNVEENSLSTMNMQFEIFYEKAKDADIIIYNSTIEGELETIDELIGKSPLIADFKAVKSGEVWCTGKNMFQQTTGAAEMISDINSIISGNAEDNLAFLHRLR